jgi:hypothetical protein
MQSCAPHGRRVRMDRSISNSVSRSVSRIAAIAFSFTLVGD